MTTRAAATAPAAWSAGVRVSSDAALVPSVITANAPKIGHGGKDHSRLAAIR